MLERSSFKQLHKKVNPSTLKESKMYWAMCTLLCKQWSHTLVLLDILPVGMLQNFYFPRMPLAKYFIGNLIERSECLMTVKKATMCSPFTESGFTIMQYQPYSRICICCINLLITQCSGFVKSKNNGVLNLEESIKQYNMINWNQTNKP